MLRPCLSTKMQVAHQVGNHTGGASWNAWSSKTRAGQHGIQAENHTATVLEMPWEDMGCHQWCAVWVCWLPHSACCTMYINHMTIVTAPGNEAHNACSNQDRPLEAKNDWTNLEFGLSCPSDVYTQRPAPLALILGSFYKAHRVSPQNKVLPRCVGNGYLALGQRPCRTCMHHERLTAP